MPSSSSSRRSGTPWGSAEVFRAAAEPLEGGETVEAMRGWARQHGIVLVGGSITEARAGREKLSNTSVAIDAGGELQAVYRKIHMFDVEVGGNVYRESESQEAGDELALFDAAGWRVGTQHLLRRPLSRALPDPGAAWRRAGHGARRVHPAYGEGPLGAPAAGSRGGEPVLRHGRGVVGASTRTGGPPTGGR